jgi:predicted RecA/RadA family phage recombinase
MKNASQFSADFIDYTNGSGSAIASGQLVQFGELHGIAVADIAVGETGSLALKGIYTVPKLTGASADATTAGGAAYFSAGSVSGSDSSGTRKRVGHAMAVAAQAATTVSIRLFNG